MKNENEEISLLLQKKEQLEEALADVNKSIIKAHLNALIQRHVLDFKENDVPLPHFIRISFEDLYDDEGGYDTRLDDIHFYDEDQDILEVDFPIEIQSSWDKKMYEEEFIYVVRDILDEEFDLDELRASLGENFKVKLR